MLVSPCMKKQKSGTVDASTHLTICDAGLCDVFKERMQKEFTDNLKVEEQRYTHTQHDLKDYLYLVPNKYKSWPIQLSTPSKTDVMIYESLKVFRENGQLDTVLFRMIMTKTGGEWKLEAVKPPEDLCGNIYAGFRSIRLTVKRAKDGTTEMVYLTRAWKGGTTFYDGDELDMKFIRESGCEVPVSPDGSDFTNYFPITIRIISPPDETRPQEEEYLAISPQFSRLANCNRTIRKAFRDCMAVGAVKKIYSRVQEYMRFKEELHDFFYVKPRPYYAISDSDGEKQFELIGPKRFELILVVPSVALPQVDGTVIHRGLRFIWWKRNGEWKLQNNTELRDVNMQITIKRAGTDEWTSVRMCSVFYEDWHNTRNDQPLLYYSVQGTSFKEGDQMNVRYVHSGRSYPVSFDGTDATNIFPCRFRVI